METTKTCKICHITKKVTEFPKAGTYKGEVTYRGECRECNRLKQRTTPANKEAQKKYKSSEKAKQKRRERRKRPEVREKEREYERHTYHHGNRKKRVIDQCNKRLKNDPVFRGIFYLKNRLRDWVKSTGERKDSEIGNYIGCTKEEFRAHIEKQFTSEMNWDNHAEYWEYDHIIPISSAKTMEEAYKLTHYTNIRPLHWLENVRKSDKLPEET